MIRKVFSAIVVIVAVVVGILNIAPLHTNAIQLTMFGEFFSAALPILAFGALVKYLCHCSPCSCCNDSGCKCCGSDKLCPTDIKDRRI
jgi:hypothetical protein